MTALWVLATFALAGPTAWYVAGRGGLRWAFAVAAVPMVAMLVWALAASGAVLSEGGTKRAGWEWVQGLGLRIDLRLDPFSLLLVLLISGIGALVCLYAAWYFERGEAVGRLVALLVAFTASMLGVVLADNLLLLYACWELTSITSYLLIGTHDRVAASRDAASQALLVTGSGGLSMLAGFVLLAEEAGTYSLSGLLAMPPDGTAAHVGVALVLIGALSKSAQVPLHFWLPGAMAAPTPISAFLHSATMVKAGVYVVARFAGPFTAVIGWWRPIVVGIGLATMLLGGWRALRQHDAKLLLAFGTVQQLGLMVALFGAGEPSLTFAGVAVLVAHALYKAALFMLVGIIDHQAHTRDLRALALGRRRWPSVLAVTVLASLSMAGVGPVFGFVAKEAALDALLHTEWAALLMAATVGGSVLAVAYAGRLVWGIGGRLVPVGAGGGVGVERVQERPADGRTPVPFLLPAGMLAAGSLVLGLWPAAVSPLVDGAAASLSGAADGGLYLWHGFTGALLLSAVVLAGGALLVAFRGEVERLQATAGVWPSAASAYQAVVRWVLRCAARVTALAQSGSLPAYLTIVLLTVVVLPASALLRLFEWPEDAIGAESPLQLAVAIVAGAIAIGVTVAARRLSAILCLGGVGFSVALLFMLHGAPDLALTQLLLETLTLIVFVLVLRRLPDRFAQHRWPAAQVSRLLLSVSVAVFVTAFAVVAGSQRAVRPVSDEHVARALSEGGGRNIVNVILVDFRGFDTLGEITVLATAAIGVASLLRAGRRGGTP